MTELFTAAREVFEWLEKHGVHGCLIGGMAVQRWGEPRLTQDVDLTVVATKGSEEHVIDICLEKFRGRLDDARAFALRHRVILLSASNDVSVDIALGATSFEAESIDRATSYEFEPGCVLTDLFRRGPGHSQGLRCSSPGHRRHSRDRESAVRQARPAAHSSLAEDVFRSEGRARPGRAV